jgi:hypothetical protein
MADVMGAVKQMALVETYTDLGTGLLRVNDSFPITPSFGVVWYRSVDFGFPEVRASMQDNPQADGTYDQTKFTGSRDVTIEGVVLGNAFGEIPALNGWPSDVQWNSSSWFISLLSAWASPSRRFRLYFTDETGRSRFMDVRGSGFSSQLVKNSDQVREFQLSLTNASGKVYSFTPGDPYTDPATATVTPDGRHKHYIDLFGTGSAGRAYPETAPYTRDYPDPAIGSEAIHYAGTVSNGCLIQINSGSGTLNAPKVTFMAPDGTTSSIGLATMATPIAANTTLTFDTVNRTVTTQLNTAGASIINVAQHLRAPLQWPLLRPGLNYNTPSGAPAGWKGSGVRGYNFISFTGTTHSTATLSVAYYDADLH